MGATKVEKLPVADITRALIKPGRGFQGFYCESPEHTGKTTVDPLECLACARAGAKPGCHMTAPVIRGILEGMRSDDFGPTVTSLLYCPRKVWLRKFYTYWVKPSEAWWAFRGQLMHGLAAEYAVDDPHAVAETRFSLLLEWDGQMLEITGQPDLYYADTCHLVDYKTARAVPGTWKTWTCPETGQIIRQSSYAWQRKYIACPFCEEGAQHEAKAILTESEPRAYGHHVMQVAAYALILAENGYPVNTAEILYQDMATQLRLPVDLTAWDPQRVYEMLCARAALFHTQDLPGILTNEEDQWECRYCPVSGICSAIETGAVEPPDISQYNHLNQSGALGES